jgi:hypothetical protein
MNRKTFLATMISGLLLWLLVPAHRIRQLFNHLKKPSRPNKHELETLVALSEIIYPEDSTLGARSLGIHNFFIVQFQDAYYKKNLPLMIRLVQGFDKESQKNWKRDFVSLGRKFQDKLAHSVVSGAMEKRYPGIQKDFYSLIDITLEGCFADTIHGGNKNKQAWNIMRDSFKVEWFDV